MIVLIFHFLYLPLSAVGCSVGCEQSKVEGVQ